MNDFLFLVPLSLMLGLIGLATFLWSLKAAQYDDLDGAAERILYDEDKPLAVNPATGEASVSDDTPAV